ncbi:aprataxin and PNK-like factor isoform X3 [Callithrix jacchus]|uniref:Aprataxin and PNKP like factor n=1 Tax=Callithrix jacchus TaxID=9483 RepID=A0A8I4A1F5_CALJA|nr:aprataxin and PNK-like factor isoform X3 [Callithrix jacchus]XP_054100854.1 aprataxin and PNK-like factor isoform X3 [Callithrix jacchus]XP_054100855.1 aprataxin and PNK-like factor isoform X3 [Callithrix jacchus]
MPTPMIKIHPTRPCFQHLWITIQHEFQVHTNPCFYQSSEKSQLVPLKTNLWCCLNPGDSFSLLVDKYTFRVLAIPTEVKMECTLRDMDESGKHHPQQTDTRTENETPHILTHRNSQMLDEDNVLNETPKSPVINLSHETTGASQLEGSAEIARTQMTTTNSVSFLGECRDFSKQQPVLAERKRILPAWMLAEHLSDQNLSVPAISGGNITQGSGKEEICKDNTQLNITQQGRRQLISAGSSENISAEQDTGEKCKNADQEESVISTKEMPQSFSAVTLSNAEMNNIKTNTQRNKLPIEELGKVSKRKIATKRKPHEEDDAVSCFENCLSAQGESFRDESQGSHPESSSNPSNSVLQGSEENMVKRTSCMYGANCYRKNPVHFQCFSHPGDSDYGGVQIVGQDKTDDRPECPYGPSCYRKNPQHKIEYRHSMLPVFCFSVRNVLDEDNDNVEQPNEYDLNDSFLDDEEEDYEPTDEDSDWEPGREDEEKEDVEELLKEAKKFMKRKK